MSANIKRTQQRLIDYSIYTGESLTHINKNYILQSNGRPPFTEQDLHAYHHGGKKNRERAINSFHLGSTRSSYRPTLKLGYDPEEEDIELHPTCVSLSCNIGIPHVGQITHNSFGFRRNPANCYPSQLNISKNKTWAGKAKTSIPSTRM